MNRLISFLFSAFIISNGMNAQERIQYVVATAGNSSMASGVQLDWTIGEVAIATRQTASFIVTEGIHQPDYIITSENEIEAQFGEIRIFPNPTAEMLHFEIHQQSSKEIKLSLTDVLGKAIFEKNYKEEFVRDLFSTADLPAGVFILTISDMNNYRSTAYQIIKISK